MLRITNDMSETNFEQQTKTVEADRRSAKSTSVISLRVTAFIIKKVSDWMKQRLLDIKISKVIANKTMRLEREVDETTARRVSIDCECFALTQSKFQAANFRKLSDEQSAEEPSLFEAHHNVIYIVLLVLSSVTIIYILRLLYLRRQEIVAWNIRNNSTADLTTTTSQTSNSTSISPSHASARLDTPNHLSLIDMPPSNGQAVKGS